MKVGIFGDSFGVEGKNPITETSKPWFFYLKDQHEVHNFCCSGTSLYYAYDRYLNQKDQNFDKVIFLVTSVGRLSIITEPFEHGYSNQVTHYEHAKGLLVHAMKNKHEKRTMLYQTAVNYFLHYYDVKQEKLNHQLLLERIRQISNSLIIPNFLDSFPEERNYTCLNDISEIDYIHYHNQIPEGKNFMFYDARHCHFNDDNNKIFGQCILEWIDNGHWNLDLSKYQKPVEPVNYYMVDNFCQ